MARRLAFTTCQLTVCFNIKTSLPTSCGFRLVNATFVKNEETVSFI